MAWSNGKMLPANSAKRPSRPILMEPGTNPCVKTFAFLVSRITGSNVVIYLKMKTINHMPFSQEILYL